MRVRQTFLAERGKQLVHVQFFSAHLLDHLDAKLVADLHLHVARVQALGEDRWADLAQRLAHVGVVVDGDDHVVHRAQRGQNEAAFFERHPGLSGALAIVVEDHDELVAEEAGAFEVGDMPHVQAVKVAGRANDAEVATRHDFFYKVLFNSFRHERDSQIKFRTLECGSEGRGQYEAS